jgi:ABC-type polysaccharide/polyol phosphate transport system ATPase subunit
MLKANIFILIVYEDSFKLCCAVISFRWRMSSPEVLVEAHELTKRFGSFKAVDHINFKVFKGECVGFLGPNGAGKTTTVRDDLLFFTLN